MYLQWVLKWMDIHLSYARKTQKISLSLIICGSARRAKNRDKYIHRLLEEFILELLQNYTMVHKFKFV